MIRLHTLLAEISLETATPYQTQFTWVPRDDGYEADAQADAIELRFDMSRMWSRDGDEYAFAYAVPATTGFTVSHAKSAVHGQLSYLRVLRTALEALLDFLAQHAPDAVDVTGFDTNARKDLQKTRLYRHLLSYHATRLNQLGYDTLWRGGRIWIVRTAATRYNALTQD
jgi:hypothetical protein